MVAGKCAQFFKLSGADHCLARSSFSNSLAPTHSLARSSFQTIWRRPIVWRAHHSQTLWRRPPTLVQARLSFQTVWRRPPTLGLARLSFQTFWRRPMVWRAHPFKLSNADRQLWARRAYPFKLSGADPWSDALIFLKLSGADPEAGAHIDSSMRDRPAPIRRGPVVAGARAPGAAAQTEVSSDWWTLTTSFFTKPGVVRVQRGRCSSPGQKMAKSPGCNAR
ncbi:hypothetical protein D3C77_136040 [compost metagenome]